VWEDVYGKRGFVAYDQSTGNRMRLTPRLRFVKRDNTRILQQMVWIQRGALPDYWDWVDVPLEQE